ncbi:MAG: purine-nucleoside phosphorylase, partial [Bacteroidales bacterium]|nr:purine-nucleoside phosphorylase [Bacteroidales bacterium]
GKNEAKLGTRFPDMSEAYDKNLISKAEQIAQNLGIKVKKGVYTATTGPTFETPSEYKYFRIIGSDTVGMSTAPEVIAARHMGLPCFAMSIITDLGVPGKIIEVTHEEVQRVAANTETKMTKIFKKLIEEI